MKRLFEGSLAVSAAALCLLAAGCDSEGTKEAKKQADAIDKSYEAQADLMEARAKNAPNEQAVHNQAEAVRNEGEAIKDHLKKDAEDLD